MTPDDVSPAPVDAQLLAHMMACDALLHGSGSADRVFEQGSPSTTREDDRARSRLLLLLKMLEAPEITTGGPTRADRLIDADPRPLLGRFQVLRELGSGGFGFVVHARDQLLGRDVALKMPLPERVLTAGDVHRFLREARAVARLDHPNIVRVFEAGELGPLGYYIASEFCDGPSLKQWLKSQETQVPAVVAARWLAALADAVQHAHDRGILHRDIKPDNVVLAGAPKPGAQNLRQIEERSAAEPAGLTPRLTDFGLAKVIDEAGDDTRSEGRIGTPHYMAPEQAAGRRSEIGPATDIYALGATLYEILTGRPPFRAVTEVETLRLLLDTEPVAARTLRPDLPRDLETICLKCLRKQPASRYPSAAELRDDLDRFLSGRPIKGRPISTWERAQRWSRRRPAVAVLLGLVILLASGLAGGTFWWIDWLHTERDKVAVQADRHHFAESLRLARRALDSGQIERAQEILHGLQPVPDGVEARDFAWNYLWRRAHRDFSQFWGQVEPITKSAVSPDGRRLATCDARGKLLVWDLGRGMPLDRPRIIRSGPDANMELMAFVNAGRFVATYDREGSIHYIHVFDCASGRRLARLECGEIKQFGGLHTDTETGRVAVLASWADGHRSVKCWTITDGPIQYYSWPITDGATFGEKPNGGRFIGLTQKGRTWLVDPWTGERRVEFVGADLKTWVYSGLYSFSADGRVFASHTPANQIVFWDMGSGRELTRMATPAKAHRIELSPHGSHLAIIDQAGRLSVFHRSDQQTTILDAGSSQEVKHVKLSFSSDDSMLAIGLETDPGGPRSANVWDVATGRRIAVFPGQNLGAEVAFVPGSRSLILADGPRPRIWRVDPPPEPDALDGHRDEAWAIAFSPDGKVLATGSDDTDEPQTIKLWDQKSGRLTAAWTGHTATVSSLAFSPDGRTLASASMDHGAPGQPNVTLWDSSSHRRLANLEGHTDRVRFVTFSPDGRYLASAGKDETVRVWNVATRQTRRVVSRHSADVNSVSFSPDGKLMATGSNDATVRIWDVDTVKPRATLPDEGNVLAVAFAPDGSVLASVNENGAIKLWNPNAGALTRTIRGEADQLRCIAFTPDGRSLAAAGKGKIVRLWDVLTGQELLSLEGHEAQVNALAFSPDGSILASCDHQGKVKLWRSDWPGLALGR